MAMMEFRVTPHPLHNWEDEQRTRDLKDNLAQWARDHLTELLALGEAGLVRQICAEYLDKAS